MIYYGIELAEGTTAQNLVVEGSTVLPVTSLAGGRLYFKSDTKKLKLYDGTQWVDILSGAGDTYTLPIATASALGGIKVGTGLSINAGTGVLSNSGVLTFNTRSGNVTLTTADVQSVLPTASASVLGGIKVGSGLTISSGVLSVSNGGVPSGSRMLFANAAAPTGWTRVDGGDLSHNRMLRVVNGTTDGTGGEIGGIHSPILNNIVAAHAHPFSATTSTTGAHSHGNVPTLNHTPSMVAGGLYEIYIVTENYTNTNVQGNHSHTVSGTTSTNTGADNWEPRYLNLLLCQKT
jgi:hypothetical protein